MQHSLTAVDLIDIISREEEIIETGKSKESNENISQVSHAVDVLTKPKSSEDTPLEDYLAKKREIYREIEEYKQWFSKRNNGDIDYTKLETEMRRDPEWVKKFDFLGYDSDEEYEAMLLPSNNDISEETANFGRIKPFI